MPDPTACAELATTSSGLAVPLYADGQVVRAADLTLDQTARDQALARMRRLLHGWGIVAGLEPRLSNGTLTISPGYGLCPSGAEIVLPDQITVTDLAKLIGTACDPQVQTCALPVAAAAPAAAETGMAVIGTAESSEDDGGVLQAWLVLVPVWTPSAPRGLVPQDCSHPGNAMAFSRACGGLRLDLWCRRPEGHGPLAADCATWSDWQSGAAVMPLPAPNPNPDLLVLARVGLQPRTGALALDLSARRVLAPLWLLQQMAVQCAIAPAAPVVSDPVDDTDPGTKPDTTPSGPPETRPTPDHRKDWRRIIEAMHASEKLLVDNGILPQPGDPAPDADQLLETLSTTLQPEELDTLSAERIAEKTGLPLSQARRLKMGQSLDRIATGGFGF